MSFAANLKDELCKDVPEQESALHALLYGFLLFSHKFSADEISFAVVHEPTARLFAEALATHCGISAKIIFHERARGTLYKVSIEKASERRKILDAFYHMPKEPSLRINRANIENEEDVPYFLRGAYLVCGSLTDPQKEYHLEFGVSYMNLSKDLSTLIGEVLPQPKSIMRRGSYIVYYKESENIEDMITYIGAMLSSLEMELLVEELSVIDSLFSSEGDGVTKKQHDKDNADTASKSELKIFFIVFPPYTEKNHLKVVMIKTTIY